MNDVTSKAVSAEPEMKTISVLTPFTVIVNVGAGLQPYKVEAGIQRVPAVVADHWYAAAHLAGGGFGTEQYARAVRASADAAFRTAKAAFDAYQALETAAAEAEAEAGLDVSEPAVTRLSQPENAASTLDDGGDPNATGEEAQPVVQSAAGEAAPVAEAAAEAEAEAEPVAEEGGRARRHRGNL